MSFGIERQLKAIHAGTSEYDIETLKKLIIKQEDGPSYAVVSSVMMADYYGADMVLGLKYYDRAVTHHESMRKSDRTSADKGAIIQMADELLVRKANVSFSEVMDAYDAGVTADKITEGLGNDLTVKQIIAMHSGIEASLTSGWL